MSNISHAPVSSPLNSQTYQMWLSQVGNHLNEATKIQTKTSTDGNSKVNYVVNGSLTYLNYTGLGGFEFVLPRQCKINAIIQVSDGTTLFINKDAKTLIIPTYTKEVTIHGNYFNES